MHLVGYLGLAQEKETRHWGAAVAVGRAVTQALVWEGPYLEVRAVVVVPVHNLPLPAVPGQHGDHLPPRQVCVELRGEDVDSRGRQGLWGRGRQGWTTWGTLRSAGCWHRPWGSNA